MWTEKETVIKLDCGLTLDVNYRLFIVDRSTKWHGSDIEYTDIIIDEVYSDGNLVDIAQIDISGRPLEKEIIRVCGYVWQ